MSETSFLRRYNLCLETIISRESCCEQITQIDLFDAYRWDITIENSFQHFS